MHSALFDSLTASEISQASVLIKKHGIGGERPGFGSLFLNQPDKAAVRAGLAASRQARALVLDRTSAATYDVVVDLESEQVVASTELTDGGAPMLIEEVAIAAELAKADPRYVSALAERGITDLDLVQLDPFGAGNRRDLDLDGRRLWCLVTYHRHFVEDNGYAHAVEGLIATVDTVNREVVAVDDYGVKPMNPTCGNYTPEHNQPMRTDVKPLEITQPEGVGFTLDGPQMSWQKWRFRINMHPLEGLVLSGVEYQDGETYRSVMHRGSLAEMIVPYGDPADAHFWRSAFDVGEYGLGRLANSLLLGCDCLGEIVYLDAVVADDDGEPSVIPNAICIHEEDAGILWKHTDWVTGNVDVRRSRKLVVSSIATVGNYHYGFYWNFFQDGHIEVDTKLMGIVQTRATEPGRCPRMPPRSPRTWPRPTTSTSSTSVSTWRSTAGRTPSTRTTSAGSRRAGNPNGNAISVTKTLIAREGDGDGFTDPQSARTLVRREPEQAEQMGPPRRVQAAPWLGVGHPHRPEPVPDGKRAGFATKNMWVTPYSPDEMRPAGEYPNGDRSGAGLPAWTAATERWRTPTSSCGTPWGSRTSHGRRTGRSCRRGRELHAHPDQLLRSQSGARRPGRRVQPLPTRSVQLRALSGRWTPSGNAAVR